MVFKLLRQSFVNQKRAMALMLVSVAMGTAVSASLTAISLDIKGKVSRELRSFGANVTIEPRVEGFADLAGQKRYLREEDIPKAKTIFWRHNIVGLAPFLDAAGDISFGGKGDKVTATGAWFDRSLKIPGEEEGFPAGVHTVMPWWEIRGRSPGSGEALLGVSLADGLGASVGDTVVFEGRELLVSGLISTGGREDRRLFMDLDGLQAAVGLEGMVSTVMVSALTTPMDEFAYKDPETMSKLEYEKWYCTGYVTSISKQLEEVFTGSRAKPIWQVAETEGKVLGRLTALIYLLTAASLVAAAIGMSTTMAASVLRRLDEVALMKAVGADRVGIATVFLTETFVIGLVGGLVGYLLSLVTAHYISLQVFGIALSQRAALFPVAVTSALVIAALGGWLPVRRALKVKPAVVLKEAL
jgi:putative ABC transport system permease protein